MELATPTAVTMEPVQQTLEDDLVSDGVSMGCGLVLAPPT